MSSPHRPIALLALVCLLAVAGCGSDSGDDQRPPQPPPTAKAQDFPKASGESFDQLFGDKPEGPVLAPTVSVLGKGDNRFGFALFDRGQKQITGAEVALYTASAKGTDIRGPYPARSESLAVKPQFVAETTANDPQAAKSLYVAEVPFRRDGLQSVIALARLDGRLVLASPAGVNVGGVTTKDQDRNSAASTITGSDARPPDVGEKAVEVDTPTKASVGGDLAKIDTRVPPSSMHDDNLADVLGRRPVVLVFATPQLCQSRVCGPVVDVAEQVKAKYGDRATFISSEIFVDNRITDPPKVTPAVAAWRLPSEPWAFVIGRDGRIDARFEGAFSVGELDRAVAESLGQQS